MPVIRRQSALVGAIDNPPYGASAGQLRASMISLLNALRTNGTLSPVPTYPDFYAYLLSLNPVYVLPLADLDTWVLNSNGIPVGIYNGTYDRSQPSLLSNPNERSTRFRGGGIALNQQFSNPFPYTLVIRATLASNASGGFFHFGTALDFTNGTGWDRQLYVRSDGRIVFYNWIGSPVEVVSPNPYNDGEPHTIVARANSQESALFIDGVKVASDPRVGAANISGFWKVAWFWNTASMTASPANNMTLQGAEIFHSSLTDSQIATIHQNA